MHAWSRALDSGWRVVAGLARYLGPLLWEAAIYLWRLGLEAGVGLRLLFLHWRARRNPARAAALAEQRPACRARRAERWATWRERTPARRMEVRAAAAVLVAIAIVIARGPQQLIPRADAIPPSTAPADIGDERHPADPRPADVTPAVDARQIVARFTADRRRLRPGEWTLLRDPLVLERGRLGTWDDFSVASPIVIKDDGRYRMWYRGCRMALREHACAIGHATSANGVVWKKSAEPVFVPGDPALRDNLEEIAVVKAGGRYFLWYSAMANPFSGRRRATLHLATSPDGLVWSDEGQVFEGKPAVTMIIQHSVFYDGQRFHLWYAAKVADVTVYALQHLSSQDGKVWTEIGGTLLEDLERSLSFDSGRLLVHPREGGGFRAFFAYEPYRRPPALGVLASEDGTTWTTDGPTQEALRAWPADDRELQSLSGVWDADGLWIWMDVRTPRDEMQVGVAFRKAG
jgi:hypothetical protein